MIIINVIVTIAIPGMIGITVLDIPREERITAESIILITTTIIVAIATITMEKGKRKRDTEDKSINKSGQRHNNHNHIQLRRRVIVTGKILKTTIVTTAVILLIGTVGRNTRVINLLGK